MGPWTTIILKLTVLILTFLMIRFSSYHNFHAEDVFLLEKSPWLPKNICFKSVFNMLCMTNVYLCKLFKQFHLNLKNITSYAQVVIAMQEKWRHYSKSNPYQRHFATCKQNAWRVREKNLKTNIYRNFHSKISICVNRRMHKACKNLMLQQRSIDCKICLVML